MSNFKYWHNEVADIPHKNEDGTWVDLETGFTYADWCKQQESPPPERSYKDQKRIERTAESRKAAKALGGKALKGSAKQKSWGEKIRSEFLDKLSSEEAEIILNEPICAHAAFWIENRGKNAQWLVDNLKKLREIINKGNDLSRQYNSELDEQLQAGKIKGAERIGNSRNQFYWPLGLDHALNNIKQYKIEDINEKFGVEIETLKLKIELTDVTAQMENIKKTLQKQ